MSNIEEQVLENIKAKIWSTKNNGEKIGEGIPTLVFVCNRTVALQRHLEKLLRYRPSADKFPVFVSHDCSNNEIQLVVESFKPNVFYIKHRTRFLPGVPKFRNRQLDVYYRISSHYKFGLSLIFDKMNFTSVIITEDDLDISSDFFEYFLGTKWLLDNDSSIYCISAWNDNGKADLIDKCASELLHRTDFLPGLGWMMTKNLWQEFGPKWPDGFWDDWMREPEQRKNRSCIRPEISRSSMTSFARDGASKGLFFDKYLKDIALNEVAVPFTRIDLGYLLKHRYNGQFLEMVYSLSVLEAAQLLSLKRNEFLHLKANLSKGYRVEYSTMDQFLSLSNSVGIMPDTRSGIPRTAYFGIVTCYVNGVRIFISPSNPNKWKGYDPKWKPLAQKIQKPDLARFYH